MFKLPSSHAFLSEDTTIPSPQISTQTPFSSVYPVLHEHCVGAEGVIAKLELTLQARQMIAPLGLREGAEQPEIVLQIPLVRLPWRQTHSPLRGWA